MGFDVHLVDGTYELFRHYHALPSHLTADGREVAAVRGVIGSLLTMVADGATHVAVATDHVVESFRNDMWAGYKTGEGIPEDLFAQFGLLEDAARAAGFTVWPMVDGEADDGLATGAVLAAADPRVDKVLICTPDKDLAQCVGGRIVQFDRRKGEIRDTDGVWERFGVAPASIPDYLALVGDTADGFPGLRGWGAKSTATVLARYGRLEGIPHDPDDWDITVRGAAKLAERLVADWEAAVLFRQLATLIRDSAEVPGGVDDWRWTGPRADFVDIASSLDAPGLVDRAAAAATGRR
ncbi:MAG TPA: 5'-3' exonuclease H3TH domain-containing protein [Acidimicrobiales bacterium]|nr:5'-3' exonuclease H3TH domain-containing protein [Acidimicrobiales bacterium]